MRSIALALALALVVAAVAAACEPTEPPAFARRSTPPATAAPTPGGSPGGTPGGPTATAGTTEEPSPSLDVPTGSPRVEIAGDMVTVVGQGDKNTDIFALDGTYQFETTACPGTGVIPFVWVYEEFGQGRGTFVDATFTVRNLVGNFFLRVAGPPTCTWTVTLSKQ